jgi:hypothetical protein
MLVRFVSLSLLLLVAIAAPAFASDLVGQAVDKETGDPVGFVTVTLLTADGKALSTTVTDEGGRFRFRGVRGDSIGVLLSRVGYLDARKDLVILQADGPTEIKVELEASAFVLAPIVVSASRRAEASHDAPASATVVETQDVEERQSWTPVDVIRRVEGVKFRQKGITSSTWGIRGIGGRVMNGANLVLQDWRSIRMPAFGLNLPYHLTTTTGDIERIEVIRAPAGVMYGPEAGTAVIHVMSRSSFDHQGTTFSLAGGGQSLMEGWGRHSGLVSPKLGYQLSLRYLKADDWKPENRNGDPALENADNEVEQVNGQASVEWRPAEETRLLVSGGSASALKLLEQSPLYYWQLEDFSQSFAQARLHHRNAMVNLVHTFYNTGSGTFVRTGNPIKENSSLYGVQVHNGNDLQTGRVMHRFSYGVDLRTTKVNTDSTLSRRREDNDTVTELGGFFQTTATLSRKVDLFAAIRADYHDRMDDGIVFPFRLGGAYKPSSSHSFRVVANRTKSVCPPGLCFMDVPAGSLGESYLGESYDINLIAAPKDGWNFRRDCEDGLCMRSAFVAGGLDDYGAADATRTWGAIQALFPDLAGVPAPSSGDVETQLATFNFARGWQATDAADVMDQPQPSRSPSTQIELGYNGWLGERVSLDVIGWVDYRDITSETLILTPNVFFDQATLEQYLVSQGVHPDTAAARASAIKDIPVGTVAPQEIGASSELILTDVRGEGSSTIWGVDIGAAYRFPSGWQLAANYSYQNPNEYVMDEPRGSPQNAGLLRVAYDPARSGLRGSMELRAADSWCMNVNGVFVGVVDAFAVLDLNLGYRFRSIPQMGLFLNMTNIFDNQHAENVGGKIIGRLITARVQLDL